MTVWTVHLADDSRAQIGADEATTRQDGSLWLLKAVAKPPTPLVPVAIFARGQWHSAFPADADPLPDVPTRAERTPRTA